MKEVNPNKSLVSYTKANIWEFTVFLLCLLIFFFFPALSQHISYHLLNRKSISPELNNTTVHSSLSLLWFLVVLPGARSPGEPGQTYLSILFLHLSAHEFISLNKKILSLTLKIQKLLLPLFSVSPRVVPPLPSLQQGLQVRRKWISGEIQQYLSHHFLFFFRPFLFLFVSLLRENGWTRMMQTAEKQVPSARCTKRPTVTMRILPADEHLLFLFCSLVNLPVCLILLSLCLSAALFNPLNVWFLLVLFFDLYIDAPSVLCPSIHHLSTEKMLLNINALCSPFVFCSPLCSKISRWARVTWEEMQKSLYHSYFNPSLNELLWKYIFFGLHFLFCSAARLQCCFCLTPGFPSVTNIYIFFFIKFSFLYCKKGIALTFWGMIC